MIAVRAISEASVARCAAVYRNAYREEPWDEEYSVDEVVDYLSRFMNSETKCAYELLVDEEIVGIALGLIVPCIGSDYFRLEDICIDPAHQKKGLGSRFIQLLSERVSARNCDSILLGTQRNYPSHHFYLKNGFQEIDSVLMYRIL